MKVPQPLITDQTVKGHLQLATRLRHAGRFEDSLSPMQAAVRLKPKDPMIQHDLGLTFLKCHRFDEAITCFERAIRLKKDFGEAHYRLGNALEAKGYALESISAYERATMHVPSLVSAYARRADLLLGLGRRKEAIDAFRAAAAAAPNTREGRLSGIRALISEERDSEAETALHQLLVDDPRNGFAYSLLGNIEMESGRFREARLSFERSIRFQPQQGDAYYNLVRMRKINESDQALIQAMCVAAKALRPPSQRVPLHLALGKAYDDLEKHGEAMGQWAEANRIKRALVPFDRNAIIQRIDRLIACFTPAFIASHAKNGNESQLPLLILGMPRSGTTLVEQIISTDPEVTGGGEIRFWESRGRVFEQMGPQGLSALQGLMADDYLSRLRGIASDAIRITDKNPFNFLWAGLVHVVFPRATIVHCRRNPIDTCVSIFSTNFTPRSDFSTDPDDLVFYYREYQRLMAHWRTVLPQDRFIEIEYEKLTADPEGSIRSVIAACGLTWRVDYLHPERNARRVRTASKWQARQPIYRTAVERWRRYEPWIGSFRELLVAVTGTGQAETVTDRTSGSR